MLNPNPQRLWMWPLPEAESLQTKPSSNEVVLGPNPMPGVLLRREETPRPTDTGRASTTWNRRDCRVGSTSRGAAGTEAAPGARRGAWDRFFLAVPEKDTVAVTFGLQSCERTRFYFLQPPSLWPLARTGLATNTSPTPSTAAGKAHVHFSSVWLRPLVSLETVTFWKVVRVSRSSSTCPWHHHPICTQPLGGPVCPCVWEAALTSFLSSWHTLPSSPCSAPGICPAARGSEHPFISPFSLTHTGYLRATGLTFYSRLLKRNHDWYIKGWFGLEKLGFFS